ncbi:uncharacterized protein E6C27_scaffold160G00460 [Cucumis melo var. makuwa]|uniref:Uncharacterized protein n=1 Tax=Cucumis melo var. makuwa TaxID=1194695 RepID=A0A5A7UZK2_CUCMM|nr:uncharacterized protein E6C27_scaffold160G00460 [Cucumis melo var. makuwa]
MRPLTMSGEWWSAVAIGCSRSSAITLEVAAVVDCKNFGERIAGAKLMVSLMSSEDPILECISGGLLEARDVLSSVSSFDPSIEVQQICQKMLQCLISP